MQASRADRNAHDAPTPPAGLDEAAIRTLVHAFYAKVRDDALIGPVFAGAVADWGPHLATMVDFWSSMAFGRGRYQGRPLPVHVRLGIGPEHFQRWLELFAATAAEVCTPEAAAFFVDRARTVARSFEMGIAFFNAQAAAGLPGHAQS